MPDPAAVAARLQKGPVRVTQAKIDQVKVGFQQVLALLQHPSGEAQSWAHKMKLLSSDAIPKHHGRDQSVLCERCCSRQSTLACNRSHPASM